MDIMDVSQDDKVIPSSFFPSCPLQRDPLSPFKPRFRSHLMVQDAWEVFKSHADVETAVQVGQFSHLSRSHPSSVAAAGKLKP